MTIRFPALLMFVASFTLCISGVTAPPPTTPAGAEGIAEQPGLLNSDQQQQLAELARKAADIVAPDDEEARNDLIEALAQAVKENIARRQLRALEAQIDAIKNQISGSQAARGMPTRATPGATAPFVPAPSHPMESTSVSSLEERSILALEGESAGTTIDQPSTGVTATSTANADEVDPKSLLNPEEYAEWMKNRTAINQDDDLFMFSEPVQMIDASEPGAAELRIIGGSPTSGAPDCCLILSSCGLCTGTLIAPNVVLTAAHCQCQGQVRVFFGTSRQTAVFNTTGRLVRHREYISNPVRNDVALVILDQPVPGTILPRALATSSEIDAAGVFVAVGFGKTETGSIGRKFEVAIPKISGNCAGGIVRGSRCNAGREFVAGSLGKDSCNGDSGGPAYMFERLPNGRVRIKLAGVTSRGPAECNGFGIYTRVDQYRDWIDQMIRENGATPRSAEGEVAPASPPEVPVPAEPVTPATPPATVVPTPGATPGTTPESAPKAAPPAPPVRSSSSPKGTSTPQADKTKTVPSSDNPGRSNSK